MPKNYLLSYKKPLKGHKLPEIKCKELFFKHSNLLKKLHNNIKRSSTLLILSIITIIIITIITIITILNKTKIICFNLQLESKTCLEMFLTV